VQLAGAGPHALDDPRKLHVPSPGWSEPLIDFALVDRFSSGDPSIDDQVTAGVLMNTESKPSARPPSPASP
jgi:hypothetical protein